MRDPLDAFDPPPPAAARATTLRRLATLVGAVAPGQRVVVALDGVDGAGKTVLGRELTALLRGTREVHRVGADGFHRPAAERYRRGRTPDSFYRDSRDHDALVTRCLVPFRAGEPYATAVHDVWTDAQVERAAPPAGPGALLLLDGIFLQRPELDGAFDAVVWVDVPFEVSVPRGNARFGAVGVEAADPASVENARYVLGQRLYLDERRPRERATWVLDNTDLAAPRLLGPAGALG